MADNLLSRLVLAFVGTLGDVTGVFINFRVGDGEDRAIVLDMALGAAFGPDLVFRSSRSIPVGTDYRPALLAGVRRSSVMLVLIGPTWFDQRNRRRLADPQDWVRREIATALRLGKVVIPLLSTGVRLPAADVLPGDLAALADRQYRRWDYRTVVHDLAVLIDEVRAADPELTGCALPEPSSLPVPRQLPTGMPHFVGRRAELRRLTALLDSATSNHGGGAVAISAIDGTAGIGKTTLALHWAHQVAGRFPDGQLYVNLRGFDPAVPPIPPHEAIRGFLDALQVPSQSLPVGVDAQAALYRSLLAGRRMLVLLDNARDADQVRPLLPAGPGCVTVITSRDQMAELAAREGADLLILDLLDRHDALELLVSRLGADRVGAEPAAVTDLVDSCARLPLALAVVAARAALQPGFPLSALAAELRDGQRRLDALTTGDPEFGVRAAFASSYRTLDPPTARLFRLIALHPGPDISLLAAASLTGIPSTAARARLDELTRRSLLVHHTPGRYRCHDLLRAYATEQATNIDSEPDRLAATNRMLDHYLHAAHAADRRVNPHRDPITLPAARPGVLVPEFTDDDPAWAWLAAEHANLLAALNQAATHGWDLHACLLPWPLATFLDRHGHWHDLLATQQTALNAACRLGDPTAQAGIHRLLSHANLLLDRADDAFRHLEQARDLWRQLGDAVGQATADHGLSLACERQGRRRDAISHATDALRLYRLAGHRVGEATALNTLGANYVDSDTGRALAYCGQAFELFQDIGDQVGQASAVENLGDIHRERGDHAHAITCYQQATVLRRTLNDRYLEAVALTRLGDSQNAAGDRCGAQQSWQQALALLDELVHPDAADVRDRLTEP